MKLRIKDLREDKDLNQQAVANALKIPRSTYCNYENGTRAIPLPTLIALADYFCVSVDYLIGRTNNPAPPKQ